MGAINNRTDQLNSIAVAMQDISFECSKRSKNQRSDPEELGRTHRKRRVLKQHGRSARVDASMVRPRTNDAGASREWSTRSTTSVRGIEAAASSGTDGVRSFAPDCSEMRSEEHVGQKLQYVQRSSATSATGTADIAVQAVNSGAGPPKKAATWVHIRVGLGNEGDSIRQRWQR